MREEQPIWEPTYYCVIDEDMKIVYRGTSIEACALRLVPGKLLGTIACKAETQLEADRLAQAKMRKLVDEQLRIQHLKALQE